MKETHRNLLVLVGFIAVLLFGFQFGSAQQGKNVTAKWEYKVLNIGGADLEPGDAATHWENGLSPFGDDGWELVSMNPAMRKGTAIDMFATLKRPKN